MKKMDWMDFTLRFSSEIFVVMLGLIVAGLNIVYFSYGNFQDQSLAGVFLSHHQKLNNVVYAKNNSIVTVVSPEGLIPHAQAEDFTGLDSQIAAQASASNNTDIVMGSEDTILAPNPDSVQSMIQKQIKIYQTQEGDTLKSVSEQFGISQQTIIWANKLNGSGLRPGWELIILPTNGVLVKATDNDTIPDMAHAFNPEKYNTNATIRENTADALLETIISYNALDGAEGINAGDYIIIPGGQIVEPPAPKVTPKPVTPKTTPADNIETVTSLGSGYDGVNHIFPKGYCTYYVATRMKITFGGNAKNWLANAKASGYVTGTEPAVRAAVVFTGNKGQLKRYGHVAYVEIVEEGRFLVSEMNYDHFNVIDKRWVSMSDPTVRGFIYP